MAFGTCAPAAMASLRSTPGFWAAVVGLLLVSAVARAANGTSAASDNFADTVIDEDGEKLDVADPFGDPSESDSIQQDSKAEWQSEMVSGLYAQRRAEKDFIENLEAGGLNLNKLVDNITQAFEELEAARQDKGYELVKEHFESEFKHLNASQQKLLSDLSVNLAVQPSDSEALKALKTKVKEVIEANFGQQIGDEASLFKRQLDEIKEQHTKQTTDVKTLFSLINEWKDTFRTGLKNAVKHLEKISESWDLL